MRKFLVAGVIAALGIALLAIPASASFDHHFSVLTRTTSQHQNGNKYRFTDKLLDPQNPQNRVGKDHGVCTFTPHRAKCRAVIRLNGEIGGFGKISVSGDLEPRHDDRLNVTGGTKDFNAVAGKLVIHTVSRRTDRLRLDLTR
jgi:hypothetical protein